MMNWVIVLDPQKSMELLRSMMVYLNQDLKEEKSLKPQNKTF